VFVPGLTDAREIARLVRHLGDTPLNILYTPAGPSLAHLADLGVRRVSLGSLLYRRALGAALETVAELRAGRTPRGPVPSYAEVDALARRSDVTHSAAR
jgi:2-methylisocitrate lyase-like PEP mutase family enzyme